jgi:signal-transduction protein with cAMP-binding, CBS, and nucleotidyltransferase domain
MTSNVRTSTPDWNLAAVAAVLWEEDCGSVPVVTETGEVIGMVTDRDICMAVATKGRLASDITVGELTYGQVYKCTEGESVAAALETMRRNKVRRLPVVNASGRLEGILSLNDIILNASEKTDKGSDKPAYTDVMGTLKAIAQHRGLPVTESAKESAAPKVVQNQPQVTPKKSAATRGR